MGQEKNLKWSQIYHILEPHLHVYKEEKCGSIIKKKIGGTFMVTIVTNSLNIVNKDVFDWGVTTFHFSPW